MSSATDPWRALSELVRPNRGRYLLLALAVTLRSLLPLVGPLLVGRAVDLALEGAPASDIVQLGLALVAVAVVGQVTAVAASGYATVLAWRTANQLRLDMTDHVLGLDHEFHRTHTPGELIQRIDGDVTSVSDFLGQVVAAFGGAALTIAGTLIILATFDWRLGAGLGLFVLACMVLMVWLRRQAVGEAEDTMSARARLYGGIEERLTAAEDLRSSGAGAHAMARFVDDATFNYDTRLIEEKAFLRLWWGLQGSVATGAALALVLGGWLVSIEAITLGTAFVLFQYTQQIRSPLEAIIDRFELIQKASGAMVRVAKLRAEKPTIIDAAGTDRATSPPPGPLAVDFDHVDFDYGDDDPVLIDVDFHLAAGRSLGVVGRTGSGKSTLSRVILRLVEASSGTVRLGGVPIGDIPMDELRRRVALIPQEVQLVHGSIRDNVTMFDPAPADQEVETAIRRVGLGHLADAGIHHPLGSAGSGLSAGEAQLLAMARVWLRQPDLVVLDEATARIDPETERRLEAAMVELLAGRTAVVIAHRLSTLRDMDEIVVMDHGRIVEHGDRHDLEADITGRYRRLLDLALEDVEEIVAVADVGETGEPEEVRT
jgi:ABC-type multidrug transport system fused ATPase/permease subunit